MTTDCSVTEDTANSSSWENWSAQIIVVGTRT